MTHVRSRKKLILVHFLNDMNLEHVHFNVPWILKAWRNSKIYEVQCSGERRFLQSESLHGILQELNKLQNTAKYRQALDYLSRSQTFKNPLLKMTLYQNSPSFMRFKKRATNEILLLIYEYY